MQRISIEHVHSVCPWLGSHMISFIVPQVWCPLECWSRDTNKLTHGFVNACWIVLIFLFWIHIILNLMIYNLLQCDLLSVFIIMCMHFNFGFQKTYYGNRQMVPLISKTSLEILNLNCLTKREFDQISKLFILNCLRDPQT